MAITISDTTISGITAGGLPSGIINSAQFASGTRRWKNAAFTKDGADGGGADTGWINHISGSFTVTEANSTIMVRADTCHGYEAGSGNITGYISLTGATTASSGEMQICKQGYSNNYAFGSHCISWVFTGCAVGSTNVYFYIRNWNATAYVNYFSPGGTNRCNLQAWYM
jgi:hypothetical protein